MNLSTLKNVFTRLQARLGQIPLWLYCAAIFVVALSARVYWATEKEGLHFDEALSVELSFYREWKPYDSVEFGKIYTGGEVQRRCFGERPGRSLIKDLKSLRKDNQDHPHTNFYYSLLRIANVGNDDFSLRGILRRGIPLNLLLFCGTFVALVALLKELFHGNKLLVSAGLIAGTLNTGSLSNTIFLRPYALQELFLVLFVLACVKLFKKLKAGEPIVRRSYLFGFSALVAGMLLTAYSSAIFAALSFLVLFVVAWRSREKKTVVFLGTALVLAVVLASVIYPNYLPGFTEGRGKEATDALLHAEIGKTVQIVLTVTANCLCKALFYTPILAAVLAFAAGSLWFYLFPRPARFSAEKDETAGNSRLTEWGGAWRLSSSRFCGWRRAFTSLRIKHCATSWQGSRCWRLPFPWSFLSPEARFAFCCF